MKPEDLSTKELLEEVARRVWCDAELHAGWEKFTCGERLVAGELHSRHRSYETPGCTWCTGLDLHSPDCPIAGCTTADIDDMPDGAHIEWTDAGVEGRTWLVYDDGRRERIDLSERTTVLFVVRTRYGYIADRTYTPRRGAVYADGSKRRPRRFTNEIDARYYLRGFFDGPVTIERIPA